MRLVGGEERTRRGGIAVTAAHEHIPVTFVICNNASYRLLQLNIDRYWRDLGIPQHDFPMSFDLSSPPIKFDEMARAMGVQAVRVEARGSAPRHG